jgi:hypothetical protein
MSDSEQPKTVEPTIGGTAGLPGQNAAPGANRTSADELADTVGGSGADQAGGSEPGAETGTGSNG